MAQLVVIEFTDLECKVIAADRSRERVTVRALVSFPLPKNDDASARVIERAHLLKEALKNNKLHPQRVSIVIPKNYVMARLVTLPSTTDDEIAGMARFEAERHIPFNAERHIISHHVISKLGVSGSQVLLAAVDRPIAQEYLDICTRAGLGVDGLGISSLCLYNAFAFCLRGAVENKVAGILNVGHACTDIVISNNGVFSFSRASSLSIGKLAIDLEQSAEMQLRTEDLASVDALEPHRFLGTDDGTGTPAAPLPGGAAPPFALDDLDLDGAPGMAAGPVVEPSPFAMMADLASGKEMPEKGSDAFSNWILRFLINNWLLQLLKEIKRTYEFARRELSCPVVTHFFLCGEGALIGNLAPYFQLNFGIESVVFNPFEKFEVPSRMAKEVAQKGPLFAALAGAVAPKTEHSVEISLLPPEYIEKRETKRQQQSWIVSGVLAVTAIILGFLYVKDMFAHQAKLLDMYRSKNDTLKSLVADLKDQKTRQKIISDFVTDAYGALPLLERISKFAFIPEKITLTRIEYMKDATVKIQGHAKTFPDVNMMQSELLKTGFFSKVAQDQPAVQDRLPNRIEQPFKYSIVCEIKKRDEGKKKASQPSSAKKKGEGETDGAE